MCNKMIINLIFFSNIYILHTLALKFVDSGKENPGPRVTVKQGTVEGICRITKNNFEYNAFLGIPYGKPPLGDLRFTNPQPAENWDGILDGTEQGSPSMQDDPLIFKTILGNEDCLYINVYVPKVTTGQKFSVMVWLHGGGYRTGSGTLDVYNPDYLIEKNVIYVSFTFRLGVFGFLSLHTPDAPGNVGLKDQHLALKWVKENIHNFGGDSDKITLFGQNTGAISVQVHTFYPKSEGLFQQVITQSGDVKSDWVMQDDPEKVAFKLSEMVGLNSNDKNDVLKHLRSIPSKELLIATLTSYFTGTLNYPFCLVIEKNHTNNEAILTRDPKEIIKSGDFIKLPMISGLNSKEGILFMTPTYRNSENIDDMNNGRFPNLTYLIPKELIAKHGQDGLQPILEKMKDFYFSNNEKNIENYERVLGDYSFVWDVIKYIKVHAEFSPTYYYYFTYRGTRNILSYITDDVYTGAAHADEIAYLYDMKGLGQDQNDALITERLVQMWTNFAKFGDPTPELNDVITTKWNPVDATSLMCLNIDVDLKFIHDPYTERYNFWEKLYNM